ncbi:hypothetical protein A0H81_07152 [Grifola frondosa]|uniref:Uncharacterized protein n=1 Tax=Grifola frondosa TaxID=5627 RepID=A0A1C7M8W3_GRIFR|nr:hypothetical protein A0H81_07152 [Grifola frondosa]
MHALHNQALLKQAVPNTLYEAPVFFSDRSTLHRKAAASLRDQNLQKKLAKEAATRKRAEDALRVANQQGPDGVITLPNDEDGHGIDTNHVCDTIQDADTNALPDIVPRGPRQRTQMQRPPQQRPIKLVGRGRGRGRGPGAGEGMVEEVDVKRQRDTGVIMHTTVMQRWRLQGLVLIMEVVLTKPGKCPAGVGLWCIRSVQFLPQLCQTQRLVKSASERRPIQWLLRLARLI